MIARAAAAAVAFLVLAALVFTGVGYLAVAIDTALAAAFGPAGAAAFTAVVLLIAPCVWALTVVFRSPRKAPPRGLGSETVISILSTLVKDTPVLAIAGAGLFAAIETFLKGRREKK
jgi:hypothetical protein